MQGADRKKRRKILQSCKSCNPVQNIHPSHRNSTRSTRFFLRVTPLPMHFLPKLRALLFALTTFAISASAADTPTLWLIGDSTVNNGSGKGDGGLWGWGAPLAGYFDPAKIKVVNRARGGRSSRTFLTEGLWEKVAAELKAGDFVLMQFGHNDGGALEGPKARASLKGNGEETNKAAIEGSEKKETVQSYGWYLRKYIADAKAKGATPIVLSQIPRNMWKDEKVSRASGDYGKWAKEAAAAGAKVNAAAVAGGIKALQDFPLAGFLAATPVEWKP